MAKGLLFIDGMDNVIADFDRIVGDIETESIESLNESLTVIETKMKSNASSVFTDGYTKGVMINSISHNVTIKDSNIYASVGVYDMSNKTNSSGRRAPEPLIAYWYEMGIQPHSTASGARLANGKRKDKGQKGNLHRGSPPRPFLSKAFDSLSETIFTDLTKKLNQSIDKGG